MTKKLRTRLEQLAAQRRLTIAGFQRAFAAEAETSGLKLVVSQTQAKRWLGGVAAPREESQLVLEKWFGEPAEQLLGPPRSQSPRSITEQELAVNAGRESVSHAIAAAAALDPSVLEHLHAASEYAAHAYYVTPPLEMLSDLVALRDTVYTQIDRTHKPLQKAQLYLIAGQVCGLLSSVSWDLGLLRAAAEQARAAHTYGGIIDHPSLQAWAKALQVTVTFWSGSPREAASIAVRALEGAPNGTARARLHSVHARSLAMIGARGEVRAELAAAADELDRAGGDEFLDGIGGELAFDRARRGLCAGASYVVLADGDQAEREAQGAVELFAAIHEDERWAAGVISAHVDLGAARALRGDLAGAQVALTPVFELDTARRTEAIAQRLHAMARTLSTTYYHGSIEARDLGAEIEDFTAASLARRAVPRALNP
ncbi:hypothetical protein [Nocardia sp. NPDC006630]|uniref:hypothetical protein n=1 Tax=Nocardia sp. NPDC006630 TaxID=3157181 RepID=UPI0033B92632